MKLTKATIASLTLPVGKQDVIVFDDELRGFGLRKRATGNDVWVVQYQLGPQQRRLTLGSTNLFSPEEARRWARQQLRTLISDPPPNQQSLLAHPHA
jgi:hypothetical protein